MKTYTTFLKECFIINSKFYILEIKKTVVQIPKYKPPLLSHISERTGGCKTQILQMDTNLDKCNRTLQLETHGV